MRCDEPLRMVRGCRLQGDEDPGRQVAARICLLRWQNRKHLHQRQAYQPEGHPAPRQAIAVYASGQECRRGMAFLRLSALIETLG